jgi:hypothetical protein
VRQQRHIVGQPELIRDSYKLIYVAVAAACTSGALAIDQQSLFLMG